MNTPTQEQGRATLPKMNAEVKAQWIEALRSGKYPQTRNYLKDNKGFCCLGVLCDIYDPKEWEGDIRYFRFLCQSQHTPTEVSDWASLSGRYEDYLIEMNDDGKSFAEIADWIEANL